MSLFENISAKRWFMGKSRAIKNIRELDSIDINGASISILEVLFNDKSIDLYTYIPEETKIANILKSTFSTNQKQISFNGKNGILSFTIKEPLSSCDFSEIKPLNSDQSNSAFFIPGKFFFKLFRRLPNGENPEEEILNHLNKNSFPYVPKLYASCKYNHSDGRIFSIAILEEHILNAQSAWDVFCKNSDESLAQELGYKTALLHKALKSLNGIKEQRESIPFQKLNLLLQNEINNNSSKINFNFAKKILLILPQIQKQLNDCFTSSNNYFYLSKQRIHGDLHLGQILLQTKSNKNNILFLDFEGEPSRTVEFRKGLRSPAVDIAGMLRSFQYASAISKKDYSFQQKAFLESYAKEMNISFEILHQKIKPYILSKAIYEACYELEFRPDWFYIPAQALIKLANPRE